MPARVISVRFFGFLVVASVFQFGLAEYAKADLTESEALEMYKRAKHYLEKFEGHGEIIEAETLAEQIYQKSPMGPYSYLIRANISVRECQAMVQCHPDKVQALTAKALSVRPQIVDAYILRSQSALAMGDIQAAQREADRAIQQNSRSGEAMIAKAIVELEENHFLQAETWYLKALNVYSDSERKSSVFGRLAYVYQIMNPPQIAKANQAMKNSVDLSPTSPSRHLTYASFLNRRVGNYEKAAEHAQRALNIYAQQAQGKSSSPTGQENKNEARLQLGLARYAMWAATFSRLAKPSADQILKAKEDVGAITKVTGVTPQEAVKYATQHMKQSSIPSAFTSAGLLPSN